MNNSAERGGPYNVSLREYIETRLNTLSDDMNRRFRDMEAQTSLAYESMQERLKVINEIRGVLADQAARYLTRAESDVQHERISEDIRSLRESRSEIAGKASQSSMMLAIVISIIGMLIGIASLTLTYAKGHEPVTPTQMTAAPAERSAQ